MNDFFYKIYAEVALRLLVVFMGLIIIVSGVIAPKWTFENLIKDN